MSDERFPRHQELVEDALAHLEGRERRERPSKYGYLLDREEWLKHYGLRPELSTLAIPSNHDVSAAVFGEDSTDDIAEWGSPPSLKFIQAACEPKKACKRTRDELLNAFKAPHSAVVLSEEDDAVFIPLDAEQALAFLSSAGRKNSKTLDELGAALEGLDKSYAVHRMALDGQFLEELGRVGMEASEEGERLREAVRRGWRPMSLAEVADHAEKVIEAYRMPLEEDGEPEQGLGEPEEDIPVLRGRLPLNVQGGAFSYDMEREATEQPEAMSTLAGVMASDPCFAADLDRLGPEGADPELDGCEKSAGIDLDAERQKNAAVLADMMTEQLDASGGEMVINVSGGRVKSVTFGDVSGADVEFHFEGGLASGVVGQGFLAVSPIERLAFASGRRWAEAGRALRSRREATRGAGEAHRDMMARSSAMHGIRVPGTTATSSSGKVWFKAWRNDGSSWTELGAFPSMTAAVDHLHDRHPATFGRTDRHTMCLKVTDRWGKVVWPKGAS